MFYRHDKIVSENHELDNGVRKKWRTAVPLWPDCARKAPLERPGARPGTPWERHGSVKASLTAMDNWTHTKNRKHKLKNKSIPSVKNEDHFHSTFGNHNLDQF